MKIIKAIEIGGFRSMDQVLVNDMRDLSVFFGRNDTGKSNVLRALNLFFNGETNPGRPFSVDRDVFSGRSKKKAWIRLRFHPIPRYASLGKSFWIKKSWTAASEPEIEFPESAPAKVRTRFLNLIDYHYVPAIKSEAIFQDLLGQVYEILTEDEKFRQSLDAFAKEVQTRTKQLSGSIAKSMGVRSFLAPPTDLTALFRTLDFQTGHDERYSLLLQRGDGVKVRHIPQILAFICDHTPSRYHIWGFEEPENSLEYSVAADEAEAFKAKAEQHQIVITSHSPAFYNLEGESVRRYFVRKAAPEAGGSSEILALGSDEEAAELMGESMLLAKLAARLREVRAEQEARARHQAELEEQVRHLTSLVGAPILFVEGESDKNIVEAAWRAARGDATMPFYVMDTKGTTKMEALAAPGKALSFASGERALFALVDNDEQGRSICRNRKHPGQWVCFENGVYWTRLVFSGEFKKTMRRIGLTEDRWDFTIEHVFPSEVIEAAMQANAYKLHKPLPHVASVAWEDVSPFASSVDGRFFYAPHKDFKVPFSEWVKNNVVDPKHFGCLPTLLEGVEMVLAKATASPSPAGCDSDVN